MTRRITGLLTCLVAARLAFGAGAAHAVPADPHAFELRQPDGTRVMVHAVGDERGSWFEDGAGYTIVREGDEYRYATRGADGDLVATAYRAGAVSPAAVGLTPGIRPSAAARARALRMWQPARPAAAITPPNGTVKNLVVLAQYSDQGVAYTRPPAEFDKVMNAVGGDPIVCPSGSVHDVWAQNSYNTLNLVSTVQPWVLLPNPESWYADGVSGKNSARRDSLVTDALNALDASGFDFSQYDTNNDGYVDAIDVIHSGYGAEVGSDPNRVWSQQWVLAHDWVSNDKNANGDYVKVARVHTEPALRSNAGTQITHIGVIAHETGHFFGLPDLYDYDFQSCGVGYWDLMGDCWGWDSTGYYPPQLSAWSKIQLGYINPSVITGPGLYALPQVETNATAFKLTTGFPSNEYLLVENRQSVGFDTQIPKGGIAIWHIDDNIPHQPGDPCNQNEGYPGQSGWPGNGLHYCVALLQADGRYDLEKSSWSDHVHGDSTDLYRPNAICNESTSPPTDSYTGLFQPTGIDVRAASDPAASMNVWIRPGYWVDPTAIGPELGIFQWPYHSLAAALAATPNDGGIVVKSATLAEYPTISRALMIRTWNGATVIGRP